MIGPCAKCGRTATEKNGRTFYFSALHNEWLCDDGAACKRRAVRAADPIPKSRRSLTHG